MSMDERINVKPLLRYTSHYITGGYLASLRFAQILATLGLQIPAKRYGQGREQ